MVEGLLCGLGGAVILLILGKAVVLPLMTSGTRKTRMRCHSR
jgi:hypothetical protein